MFYDEDEKTKMRFYKEQLIEDVVRIVCLKRLTTTRKRLALIMTWKKKSRPSKQFQAKKLMVIITKQKKLELLLLT